jgi:hypothetical protein
VLLLGVGITLAWQSFREEAKAIAIALVKTRFAPARAGGFDQTPSAVEIECNTPR